MVAAFGAFLAFLDSTVVNVAFPDIQAAFPHTSIGTLSWVLNAYNVVFAGLLVLSGRFADLLGRRRLFKMGLILFTLMSALCAVSTSVQMLIVFRVFQGAGAAMLVPASLGIVVHASPLERRSRSLSLWAASAALASGLGPPIGGALVDAYNWRMVFLINLPLGVIAWFLARRMVIESRAPGRRIMPDLRGALVLSLAIAALTLGIVQGGTWGWRSAPTLVAFAVAAIGIALTVQSSRHHHSPILDPDLLRIRAFTVSNLVMMAAGLGLYTYLLAHILWLHYVWGYSLLLAGLAVAPGAVVAAILATPFGRLADRFGPRVVVVPGALVSSGAYVWYATRVGLHPDFVGQWLPGQILSGIGVGATVPVAAAGGLSSVPAGQYATASAVSTSTRQIGGVLGIAILTIFIAHPTLTSLPDDLRHGWELAAGSFAVAAVIALFFGRVRVRGEALDAASGAPRVLATRGAARRDHERAGSRDRPPRAVAPRGARRDVGSRRAGGAEGGPDPVPRRRPGGHALSVAVRSRGRATARRIVPRAGPGCDDRRARTVTGAPRAAAVIAQRDSTLIAIGRDGFERLAAQQPAVVGAVAKGLAQQLQASRLDSPTRTPVPKVISLVALDRDVPVGPLADGLRESLDRRLRVTVLDVAHQGGLQRAEDENDRVLLVSGATEEDQAASMRQADRVVLAATGPGPASLDGLAAGVADLEVPCDVVLTGGAPTQDEVVSWHDRSGCRRVYHLGDDRAAWDEGLRPLVDRLTQSSVALVLGGGGARALAHLGVLHAFERAGITIDRLAGTSIGALIAALSATGAAASEVEERMFEEFVQRNPFGDYRLSLTSLARGERARALLRRCFDDRRVETLPRELVVASTDLYERVPVYHRRGIVADVVGASMCMPVLLPPRRLDGRVLVDGSLTDNCPTAPFAELEEGPVVAVRIASGAADPHETRTPSLGETLLRIVQMGDRGVRLEEPQPTAAVAVIPDSGRGRALGVPPDRPGPRGGPAGRRGGDRRARGGDPGETSLPAALGPIAGLELSARLSVAHVDQMRGRVEIEHGARCHWRPDEEVRLVGREEIALRLDGRELLGAHEHAQRVGWGRRGPVTPQPIEQQGPTRGRLPVVGRGGHLDVHGHVDGDHGPATESAPHHVDGEVVDDAPVHEQIVSPPDRREDSGQRQAGANRTGERTAIVHDHRGPGEAGRDAEEGQPARLDGPVTDPARSLEEPPDLSRRAKGQERERRGEEVPALYERGHRPIAAGRIVDVERSQDSQHRADARTTHRVHGDSRLVERARITPRWAKPRGPPPPSTSPHPRPVSRRAALAMSCSRWRRMLRCRAPGTFSNHPATPSGRWLEAGCTNRIHTIPRAARERTSSARSGANPSGLARASATSTTRSLSLRHHRRHSPAPELPS